MSRLSESPPDVIFTDQPFDMRTPWPLSHPFVLLVKLGMSLAKGAAVFVDVGVVTPRPGFHNRGQDKIGKAMKMAPVMGVGRIVSAPRPKSGCMPEVIDRRDVIGDQCRDFLIGILDF